MTGCFDGAVGDAEGTDDASENDASENGDTTAAEGTSTGTDSSTQARTWYSSGGTFGKMVNTEYYHENGDVTWVPVMNMYGMGPLITIFERCDWGPYYDWIPVNG